MVNLRTFDLNLLRVFEAITESQSVSKAADKLGLSQSAVSNALDRMRRQFDDPLFIRTHRGMEPTPKAQDLAEVILTGLTTIRAGLSASGTFDPARSHRRFSLLMTDVGEMTFLPTILSRLNEQAPQIDLNVIEFGLERYEELLEAGIADLAVGQLKLPDTLCSQEFHNSDFAVVASRTNPIVQYDAEGKASIALETYLDAPHVQQAPRGASGNPVAVALGSQASRRRIALSVPHASVLPMILPQTSLIATVPKVCADLLARHGDLVVMPTPFPMDRSHVTLWWHRRNTKDPGHSWLREMFLTSGV